MPSPSPSPPCISADRRNWISAATVLLSAWLLFQVQPMVGKRILPWFGGGPAVWTTAMLFFQVVLLAGYGYAHLSIRCLRPRAQAIAHAALLAATCMLLVFVGVIPDETWKPVGSEYPRLRILIILFATVGLPFLMLSATAPLVQAWFGRTPDARSPYRLYALSNVGSLAALLSYPLLVEPLMAVTVQGVVWSYLFVLFAMLCSVSGWRASSATVGNGAAAGGHAAAIRHSGFANEAPSSLSRFYWLALPACASALLLAVTNYLCQDIASLPLLWVAPLAIYLVTFILSFDSDRWYRRSAWLAALGIASFAVCASWLQVASLALVWQVGLHLALLLGAGMVCHGEVARLRPGRRHLTSYYLHLAAGGALGGFLVAVVAPMLLADHYELPLGLLATWGLAMSVLATDRQSALFIGQRRGTWIAVVVLCAALTALAWDQYTRIRFGTIASARNFFGVLKVQDYEIAATGAKYRRLLHGRISHGGQFLDKARRREATQYFDKTSGIGQLLKRHLGDAPRHVGIVGLGVGTLAAYAEAGDDFQFYEIDPQVIEFADEYFTYLADARQRGARVMIAEGDARLALALEAPQQFDVLVLDAFSGDAIPIHLLTLEAFEVYLRHLRQPSGVLAVQITNRHVDMAPVVKGAADRVGLHATIVRSKGDTANVVESSVWVLLRTRGATSPQEQIGELLVLRDEQAPILWTDDYSSVWRVLRER